MRRRLTLHIGLEKTGTDSFQRFCTERRDLFKKYSTLYPTRSLAFGGYNHEPLVACYLDYHDFSIRSSGQARPLVLRSLMAEIDQAGASNVLISGEHFSSRFREAEIGQLAADFASFDCRVAVVLREHRARLYSAYSQAVLSGRDMTLDEYCDEVFHPDNRYMRYGATIGAWEQAFGRENIAVFCHQRGKDIVPVLCEALVAPDLPPPVPNAYWDNLSIGPGPTELLRRVNRAIARIPGASNPTIRLAIRRPRRSLARWFAKFGGSRDNGHWRLSQRNLERLADIVDADNIWLDERYGVRLANQSPSALKATS